MSCITEILKLKGDKEALICGEIAIEGGGSYKGYEYLITFVSHGHRCGYVAVPTEHPLHSFNEQYDFPDIHVHGGITFFDDSRFGELLDKGHTCADKWIGFDAAHYDDIVDMNTVEKLFGQTDWLRHHREFYGHHNDMKIPGASHKDFSYMEKECHSIIDQLIEKAA